MPRIIQAVIVTPTGARIEGDVANLTSTGLFIRTADELRFGQAVTVKILSHSIPGQVLFVSKEPNGVVLSLRPNPEARNALLTGALDVEVLDAPAAVAPDELWAEHTNKNELIALGIEQPVRLDTGDLDVVMSPTTNPDETPLELDAFDETLSPSAELPVIDDDLVNDTTSRIDEDDLNIESSLLLAAVQDDLMITQPPTEGSSPFDIADDLDIPILDPDPHRDPLEDQPTAPEFGSAPALELVETPPPDLPSAHESLPTLDKDGYTVRFSSPDAYQVQYTANIEHGGLEVSAAAIPIGTQRMLALEVPGSAAYTVSARVIYYQDGKLGFMLDSFNIHKARLRTLAS